jgi:hypothetical protein
MGIGRRTQRATTQASYSLLQAHPDQPVGQGRVQRRDHPAGERSRGHEVVPEVHPFGRPNVMRLVENKNATKTRQLSDLIAIEDSDGESTSG